MFSGFVDDRVDVGEVTLRVRYAGQGPAVLLIHGHPRTGATWHRVAARLVEAGFTVVCPDMRGYGQSSKAEIRPDHSQQSKRAVAQDFVRLMDHLGHRRFSVAGHDRGCYVALRLALDHPGRVERLVVMDGVPISEALGRCDWEFARRWYHWFFFAPADRPERAILSDPDAWYDGDPVAMGSANYQEFKQAIHDAGTVRAMLEDYRAGLGVDREDEESDRQHGRAIACPTLFLWSSRDDMEDLYGDPLAIWRAWSDDLRGHVVDSGHHMAEENPEDVAAALIDFLDGPTPSVIVDRLREAGCVFAEDEARLLMSTATTAAELEVMVERRVAGLPLEQVLGWAEFCGLRIAVDPGVFVPRRRTKLLVREATAVTSPGAVVVDLCCGSGAVGAALMSALDRIELHAADIDPAAVRCARGNLAGTTALVYQGDLYQALPATLRGSVDVLVANVPYVPTDEMALMPAEARAHEPRVALDGGEDGLDILRRVAAAATDWLAPGGRLLIETSERQAPLAAEAFSAAGLAPRIATSDEHGATVVVGGC